ncbi:lycopene cyclase family protein [Streptomyces sp. NBC_00083]|uniref:lycopene cyclase family protein n=1 Tax=Streptomyces sp. NBC_00083 TaxID=2975647 RepID=UPI00224ECD8E|nr:lycopene cyclase family protein [Streptomyces sp. NBC_00083]MCX5384529.1 lycopene cyclase family protein [Streptomyces sp. NBC_00083]
MDEADVVVVGAGAAGLSLTERLAAPGFAAGAPSVVLLDAPPGPLRPPRRTWCFWESGAGRYDAAVTATWRSLRVHAQDGRSTRQDIAPLRYKMIRSDTFQTLVEERLAAAPHITRRQATVQRITPAGRGSHIHLRDAEGRATVLHARYVFDSRPPRVLPPARTCLLQHFRGWFVRTRRPVFDRGAADLMDFRTPQPRDGLAFFYVLPTSATTALVEYTQFSAAVLPGDAYDRMLRGYLTDVLGAAGHDVTDTETGVIPMTDGRFARRSAPGVFPIGVAGGAVRPSTGYAFSAIQRQVTAVSTALRAGRDPLPPAPHSRRSRAMDAVLLRGLASGRVDGAAFFEQLFSHVPMERLLHFLDGRTTPLQDVAIGLRTPILPMVRSALAAATCPRRPVAPPARPS